MPRCRISSCPRHAPGPSLLCEDHYATYRRVKDELSPEEFATLMNARAAAAPKSGGRVPEALRSLAEDATEAGWRLAGSQLVKLARDPLAALLARNLAPDDESMRARLSAFLQTEIGEAVLAGLLSLGLAAAPGEVQGRLAAELRVRAMSGAGEALTELLMEPLRQVISMYIQTAAAPEAEPRGLPAKHEEPARPPAASPVEERVPAEAYLSW
jgi:hypothetical protein